MDAETVRTWCTKLGVPTREGNHPKAKLLAVGVLRMSLIPALLRARQSGDAEALALF
jgi:hypothetical protein